MIPLWALTAFLGMRYHDKGTMTQRATNKISKNAAKLLYPAKIIYANVRSIPSSIEEKNPIMNTFPLIRCLVQYFVMISGVNSVETSKTGIISLFYFIYVFIKDFSDRTEFFPGKRGRVWNYSEFCRIFVFPQRRLNISSFIQVKTVSLIKPPSFLSQTAVFRGFDFSYER